MELIQSYYQALLSNTWTLLVLLVGGFYLLVKGADMLVDGAGAMAKRFGVSDLIIGLTVVAFGTSMPEFVVNMLSSGEGNSELAITNVLGSNTINIFVILGLTALVWPVSSEVQSRKVDIPYACAGAFLIFIFALNGMVGCLEGMVLVLGFLLYMGYLFKQARQHKETVSEQGEQMSVMMSAVWVVLGLAGLTIGGQLCVDTATTCAKMLGVSDAIIGLTVVALGTSLPELATSVVAAMRHNSDLALGNCVGSCIFNVFFVLAISACVHPLLGYEGLWLDAAMAVAGPVLIWIFVSNDSNKQISRLEGGILLAIYTIYLVWRLINC